MRFRTVVLVVFLALCVPTVSGKQVFAINETTLRIAVSVVALRRSFVAVFRSNGGNTIVLCAGFEPGYRNERAFSMYAYSWFLFPDLMSLSAIVFFVLGLVFWQLRVTELGGVRFGNRFLQPQVASARFIVF